nr:hypothetical protein Iba_chr07cCG2270 [Ipomoea batatas]
MNQRIILNLENQGLKIKLIFVLVFNDERPWNSKIWLDSNSEPVRCGFDSTDLVCDALPLLQVYFLAQLPFSSACKTSKNGIAVGTPNRKRILVMGKFQALCIASVVGIASIHCFHFGAL